MSVFVKDIDVPSDCDGCWHPTCNLWLQTDVGKRHKDCPISPMPEKHGRLKDSDSISADIRDMFCQGCLCSPISFNCQLCEITKVLCIVDSAPTIVEADGDI